MVDAKEKLVDVVTAARKQHADYLRVNELDFKRNRKTLVHPRPGPAQHVLAGQQEHGVQGHS